MKHVVVLLETAVIYAAKSDDLHVDLGVSPERLKMLLAGQLLISATIAVKFEKCLGVKAIQLLTAQARDQLEAIGYDSVQPVHISA